MALFGTKKNTEKKVAKTADAKTAAVRTPGSVAGLAHILRHARITEKASMQQGQGVYVFDIASSATKRDVMKAVHALYNVTPRKVAIINVPTKIKKSMRTGRTGKKTGGKKAYVYLKSGETINL
jgi:large subunit ribosomal protein L23